MYDSRIGRWLSTDPKGQYFSPYIGMGNDPANGVDLDGGYSRLVAQALRGLSKFFGNDPGELYHTESRGWGYNTSYTNGNEIGLNAHFGDILAQQPGQYDNLIERASKPSLYGLKVGQYNPSTGYVNGSGAVEAPIIDPIDFAGGLISGGIKALGKASVKGGIVVVERGLVTEGIYEFTAASGKTYVGQSMNIPARLEAHIASGKLLPGTSVSMTEVLGGKTAREIAEQLRINSLGGIHQNGFKVLENVRNPIGPARRNLLP